MPGVTEEQITAAKQMSAIEFLRRYRPGQLVKAESRGEFQLKEHDSFKINEILTEYLKEVNIELIDFKLEFGRDSNGKVILADEISPDTCRFWDTRTHAHLDKDLFRRDLGGEEEAYQEVKKRILGE